MKKCSRLGAFMKMGLRNAFVDNLSDRAGVCVDINKDGCLIEFGVDKHLLLSIKPSVDLS